MVTCKSCGTNNIDGSEYCDECGMKLDAVSDPFSRARASDSAPVYQPPSAVAEPVATDTSEGPMPAPPSFTTSTTMPKPAMPSRSQHPQSSDRSDGNGEPGQRFFSRADAQPGDARGGKYITGERRSIDRPRKEKPAADPSQTFTLASQGHTDGLEPERPQRVDASNPRVTARLVVERGGRVGREFAISGTETNIGRWDADSGIFPDVDLDEDDPEAKVSRRHARVLNHNGQYFIEDLGSTNGTFVNRGRRLLPGKRHALQSGDEIIVGKTFLKFQILR
ncbi:MAG TPA: FHA domain-containing protein [Blastocatellia bacterium]|nr:FHA domain-containing protein [Blastocatellia bacterium]